MRPIDFEKETFSEKEKRNIEILEILRRRGPISRPEISKETGINVVTISSYIDNLIRQNVVHEKELDVSEGGRRPGLLDLNPQGAYVVGVGLNLLNMVGVLIDLKGNIIFKTQTERKGASVEEVVECLLEIMRQIVKRSKGYNIQGVGVGMAGVINKAEGSVCWPERISPNLTNYASVNIQFKDLIEKEFDLPAIIENDATAACFGEHWLRLEPDFKNVLFMFSGVGVGLVINGQVYTGSQGCAGEPSINNYNEDKLFNCAMGNPCFLKRWDTDLGIVEDVKSRLARDKAAAERFTELTAHNVENIDLRSVLTAARAKHEASAVALSVAAKRLGVKIAYLVNLFNPQIVIIGGGLEEAGEEFLNKVASTIKEWAFREAVDELKITYSQLRENAVALGAGSLVMQKLFAQLWQEK
ncbi:MAG: ROK family transcriptional regulator [Candidatus Omnitrophica bacterium]|nr:ROK family transcriptional regulator [Candidatus Omnitrophota bacterium]